MLVKSAFGSSESTSLIYYVKAPVNENPIDHQEHDCNVAYSDHGQANNTPFTSTFNYEAGVVSNQVNRCKSHIDGDNDPHHAHGEMHGRTNVFHGEDNQNHQCHHGDQERCREADGVNAIAEDHNEQERQETQD